MSDRPGRWNAEEGCWMALQCDLPDGTVYHHRGSPLRWGANRPSHQGEARWEKWTNWIVVDEWPDGTEPTPPLPPEAPCV